MYELYEFVLYNLYKKCTNYMNSYVWICTKISEKKETRLGFQPRTNTACNRCSGTPSTNPPPHVVPILFIYHTIRLPSKNWDCTNSFVWHNTPRLRRHGDSQTEVFFPPRTPSRRFHHQKVLCNDANIYICIALKIIINTPLHRSSSLD